MSITVADCLALPSLRDATVAGGSAGLNKIVASVTVLEYANVPLLGKDLFAGSEILITAFATARNDVQKQCDILRHLYNRGVVAVVLYYIGVIVPKLDKKLIATANELSLPLIAMPPNNMNYRYSTAIQEITETILYDSLHDKYFVPTIIERVAQFPVGQRNLDNVLRILSDRFHITIIVTDEQLCLVSEAIWPSTSNFDTEQFIKSIEKDITSFQTNKITEIIGSPVPVFNSAIYVSRNQKLYIFAIMDEKGQPGSTPDKNALLQISESIQLIISMQNYSDWSHSSNQLVEAIMNNDVYRTAQVATQSGFDIKTISDMWILIISKLSEEKRAELLTKSRMLQVKEFLSYIYKTVFVGSYEECIVCFMSATPDSDTMGSAPYDFMDEICVDEDMLLLSFSNLRSLVDVRKAYDAAQRGWFALKAIYKTRSVFSRQELNFALSCLEIIEQKDDPGKDNPAILEPLLNTGNSRESLETLSVFLLDACNSITETAKLMHVHPNTVKYRLKEIKKKLKVDIAKLPDAYELYLAVALKRLRDTVL